jgi:SAM-dependent methyltransferase
MLGEHLSQAHDAASRRSSIIASQVDWIHRVVLNETPTRVLDLACGPGLYANRLAKLGHELVGIDYSPASIEHAADEAQRNGLTIRFVEGDIRTVDYGGPYDLVMLLSGELNVFRPLSASDILVRAAASLCAGGRLLLEVSTVTGIRAKAARGPRWYTAGSGLWSDGPHLVLEEAFWDAALATSTTRYFVIDAASAATQRFGVTHKAYEDTEYTEMLRAAEFTRVQFLSGLGGESQDPAMRVILSVRK